MPWPVPWPKCAACPASAITARAIASAARPLSAVPRRGGRLDRLDGRRLRPGDQLVDRQVPRGGLADEQRPRHVAAIAGDLRAEVEEQDRPV